MGEKAISPEGKEKEILEAAERMVREGGYNAFSFREIAKEIGIKSSSVHYHFPTKEDLGTAVAAYYTDKFLNSLGEPQELIKAGKDPISTYIGGFKSALVNDRRMCLCGLLGAEINSLPEKVAKQTKVFFERNVEWLMQAYTLKGFKKDANKKALQTLALLEGALITSSVLGEIESFNLITDLLKS